MEKNFFILIDILIIIFFIKIFIKWKKIYNNNMHAKEYCIMETNAEVTGCYVQKIRMGNLFYYSYKYKVDGKEYISKTDVGLKIHYQVLEKILIKYDPNNPSVSIIPEFNKYALNASKVLVICSPIFSIIIFLLMILHLVS